MPDLTTYLLGLLTGAAIGAMLGIALATWIMPAIQRWLDGPYSWDMHMQALDSLRADAVHMADADLKKSKAQP